MSKTMKMIEVCEQVHNGNNWETIEGAAWDMEWPEGMSFRDACIRHGGDFDRDEAFRLVAHNDDGDIIEAEVFEPGSI